MEGLTLESILRCRYNINETILVEGKFVYLLRNSKSATSLVSLAISERCFFVAKVILSGYVPDYDLISMVPLPFLSFAYLDTMKMLKIRCKVKDSQIFQLCSSYKDAEIWDNFKDVIKYLGINKESEIWVDQSLKAPTARHQKSANSMVGGDIYHVEVSNAYNKYLRPKLTTNLVKFNRDKSISLPTLIQTCASGLAPAPLNRRHSADYIDFFDLQFESFVNDAPTRFSEYNGVFTSCSWNGSADDVAVVCTEKLNAGNTNSSALMTDDSKQTDNAGFLSRFRSIFSCNKCKQKPTG